MMLTIDFPPRTIGGEGVYAGAVAPLLAARGIDLEAVAPGAPGDREHDAALSFRVHRVPVSGGSFVTRTLSFVRQTRPIVRNFHGDVVYSLRPVAQPSVPLLAHFHATRAGQANAARRSGRPVAAIANAVFVPLERSFARRATIIAGVNAGMRAELALDRRETRELVVIPNGVDTNAFSPAGRQPFAGGRLLFVGRLDPLKRVPDLLQAVATLTATHPSVSLTIAGSGREQSQITALVNALGLGARVGFLAHVDYARMPDLYRGHDLLVLPSAYESFGLVALEAMACGTPAITSEACARLGQDSFAVGDVAGLAALLRSHLDGEDAWSRRSEAARQLALSHTWSSVVDTLVQTLETTARA